MRAAHRKHYYYKCTKAKREHACEKKSERKGWIEKLVVRYTVRNVLTDENIALIAKRAMEIIEKESADTTYLDGLNAELKDVQKKKNLVSAIEQGIITSATKDRLDEMEQEKSDIEGRIAREEMKKPLLNENRIRYRLTLFKSGNVDDQTGRTTELATRAAVAMAGSFGYELDLNLLTEEEKEQVRAQIKNYHRFEMLIRQGRYYRLTDVWQKKEYAAWEYCRPDGSEALVTVVTLDTQCNPATEYVKLRGLGEDKKYRVEVVGMQTGGENGQRINGTPNSVEPEYYTGAQLVHAGLPVPRLGNGYKSWQVYVKEV